MTYGEQIEQWFEKYDADQDKTKFKETDNKQLLAIQLIASKIKDKSGNFLHGEHDCIYFPEIDEMEKFSENEVETLCYCGVFIDEDGNGLKMYASL